MCGGLAVSCWYGLVEMWSEGLSDFLLSYLKSENVAIILSCEFLKGHLNLSGHYWDVFWEPNFALGLRCTAVIVCRGKGKCI